MKKIFLIVILFFGLIPYLQKGKICLLGIQNIYADDYGEEYDSDPKKLDLSSLYRVLSTLFGFNVVGVTQNSYGQMLLILNDGSVLDPIGATVTDNIIHELVLSNPELFPAEIPSAADFENLDDFLHYVDDLGHVGEILDDHTNATNNVLDDCLKALVQQVMNRDPDNPFSSILNTTFGSQTENSIDFSQYTDASNTNDDGYTDGQPGCMDIHLNMAALQNASQEERMATIYHEILHAYLNEMHVPRSQQHDKIANDYLEPMISQLKSDFPTLSDEDATALAWGGLSDTTRWKSMTSTQKNDNLLRNDNFKNLNNVKNGAYGTPCP